MVSKLPEMLPKYYEVRGWNPDGTVTPETRERLVQDAQVSAQHLKCGFLNQRCHWRLLGKFKWLLKRGAQAPLFH